ncbi:class I SAM-dependent methyltransferase [Aeromicrobium duanguangcaii]|uniref:Class I SAM-dependent methyltransferase n=1 Tax=Aeromicrobium duanguangcaii TaxID=2968086 RepID=A0ABY5KF93_9ACTN|nr:class I SAM-dependent methyltransferase [Aeromicrobium duanguangcaii]MCD9154793.1 class I SAM-dependent methyltransferase [Aeromicrobium duanguangcaii]UUI67792.1 class I SAM-dependent methyltransferase [Aeromicrobium duanguangcaii]
MTSSPQPRWFTDTQPGHSQWFIERFRTLEAEGADLLGEARFADMLAERGSRILDAGCGAGRMAAALHAAGHQAYGVDVDPELIAAAESDHPGPTYGVVDLSELTLADVDGTAMDLVVCAGNVMVFLAPGTELRVLERLCAVTREGGRVVVGSRPGTDYPFEQYDADLADLAERGIARVEQRFSTWHLDPFEEGSDFAVTVLRRGPAPLDVA